MELRKRLYDEWMVACEKVARLHKSDGMSVAQAADEYNRIAGYPDCQHADGWYQQLQAAYAAEEAARAAYQVVVAQEEEGS